MNPHYGDLEIKEVKVIFDGEEYDPDKKVALYLSESTPVPEDYNHIHLAGLGMEAEGLYVDLEGIKERLLPVSTHTDQLLRNQLFKEKMNSSVFFTISIDDSDKIPLRELETAYLIKEGIDEYLYYQWELEDYYTLNSRAVDEHRDLYNQVFGDKSRIPDHSNKKVNDLSDYVGVYDLNSEKFVLATKEEVIEKNGNPESISAKKLAEDIMAAQIINSEVYPEELQNLDNDQILNATGHELIEINLHDYHIVNLKSKNDRDSIAGEVNKEFDTINEQSSLPERKNVLNDKLDTILREQREDKRDKREKTHSNKEERNI